jgi:hypothetical protein
MTVAQRNFHAPLLQVIYPTCTLFKLDNQEDCEANLFNQGEVQACIRDKNLSGLPIWCAW